MPLYYRRVTGQFICLLLLGLTVPSFLPDRTDRDGQLVYRQYTTDKNRFREQVQQLVGYVSAGQPNDSLRAAFRRSRLAYKRVEWLLHYFQPFLATRINGPPVAEVEGTEPGQTPILPTGLQVVESLLFPVNDPSRRAELLRELTTLLSYTSRLDEALPDDQLTDSNILEATRQQLFRLLTAGVTGYDAPETLTGLTESAESLRTLHIACRPYVSKLPTPLANQFEGQWMDAIRVLEGASDFATFDRVSFIRNQLYPLCRSLQQMRRALSISVAARNRFLSPMVATLSDSGAFQPDYLTNFGAFVSSPKKVALGRMLFFDPRLSGNNSRSCATCHQPERAFTDGLPKSRALSGRKHVLRNAPSLINAGLQSAQFYDSRASYLEDQAHDVLTNTHEMRSSPEEVVKKLSANNEYRRLFSETFPAGLTAATVRNALASYVRSLVGLNAPSDRYLRGEPVSLSSAELLGMNLFLGKARCATCHFFPVYNGFLPPDYEKTESEIIGVPRRVKKRNARLDLDLGRYYTYQKDRHRFAFKTPSIRNVALTAPYMHNGAYKTLEQVIDFYNRGGAWGIGIQLDGQTLPKSPLNLTTTEQMALVAFLRSLTDTTGLMQRPDHLPGLANDAEMTRRKPRNSQ